LNLPSSRVHWSPQILDDTTRNLVADGRTTPEKARRFCEAMERAFPEALVKPPSGLADQLGCDPGDRHVLPALIRHFHEAADANAPSVTCWGTGSPLREFLYVDDLGEACVFALEHWSPAPGELTHLNVATATGYQGVIEWDSSKPDGTPKKQLDVSHLAVHGWRARIPLAEGLASTVALFREELAQQLVRLYR